MRRSCHHHQHLLIVHRSNSLSCHGVLSTLYNNLDDHHCRLVDRFHRFFNCIGGSISKSVPSRNNNSRCNFPATVQPVQPVQPSQGSATRCQLLSSTLCFSSMSVPTMELPTSNETASSVPSGHVLIQEGPISMMYPQLENSVFYNPVQVQNRDLSVLIIGTYAQRRYERIWAHHRKKDIRREKREYEKNNTNSENNCKLTKEERLQQEAQLEKDIEEQLQKEKSMVDFVTLTAQSSHQDCDSPPSALTLPGLTVLDALAASGLRSLRYWKEIPGVRTVVVNDLDPVAIDMARENVIRNGCQNDLVTEDKLVNNVTTVTTTPPCTNRHRPKGIILQVGDATHEMYTSRIPPSLYPNHLSSTIHHNVHQRSQYDVIDLDPYGSASPFLDAAMQSVVSGGLLAITCTDMAALGGSHPETCYGRYAAFPIQRSGYLQELALRILLYQLSVIAGRYGRTIRPVLSVGMAFYCRVFVEVYDDKAGVNNLSLMHGHLFQSTQCSSFHVTPIGTNELVSYRQSHPSPTENDVRHDKKISNIYKNGRGPCDRGEPLCGETGASYKIGGPLWIGPLHDLDVVNDAIARLEAAQTNNGVNPSGGSPRFPLHTATTLHGLLVSVSEELPDVPLYHNLTALCSAVNSSTIPMKSFCAALVNAGYRVSAYHKEPQAVKTDAPNTVVWDVVRAWCKTNPPSQRKDSKKHETYNIATKILSKEIHTEIDFTIPKGVGFKKKARRYSVNPEPNWGPKKAASGRNKRKLNGEEGGRAVGNSPNV